MARGGYGRRKVRPNLAADREGTRLLNLTVLRRLDPAVADILITAAHVTAYSFDPTKTHWSRKGVEGSLFVVKRNAADEVTGIWFYDPEECEEVAQLFSRAHEWKFETET
ncbi:hypothetical protein ACQ4PT_015885 [Festuca glaucescens]